MGETVADLMLKRRTPAEAYLIEPRRKILPTPKSSPLLPWGRSAG